MKEGMTFLFRGSFSDPIQARTWKEGRRSQANAETMDASELKLVVVSLYANPLLSNDMHESIRRQIRHFQHWIQTHPNWVHARSSKEAQTALAQGKRVAVLSIEGASGLFDHDADLKEWIDEAGVRIITLLHLTDDLYGGVALLPGMSAIASPGGLLAAFFRGTRDPESGVRINPRGLHTPGQQFAERLLNAGVWIDLSHASDRAQEALIALHRKHQKPLLYTHTVLRETLHAERGLSLSQLKALQELGGFVGLMPSHNYLKNTPISEDTPECEQDLARFKWQWDTLSSQLGSNHVALGTDTNGAIPHLKTCEPGGYRHIGQLPQLWKDLKTSGPTDSTLQEFLTLWAQAEQTRAHANPHAPEPEP